MNSDKQKNNSDLSRRQFLVHSAGVAGASMGLRATRAADSSCSEAEVRLGFIGLGDRGRQLLGAALASANARVTALCDVDPSRLKRSLQIARGGEGSGAGPRGFTNYRALLDCRDVDAVVISTPAYQHLPHTLTALAAGRHVYCEKPLGLTVEECRQLRNACADAEGRGQIYQCGLQRRYNPRYRESIRYVQGGEPGKVLFVRAQWHGVASSRKNKPWLFRQEKSGGLALEQGTHQFDVFNWVFSSTPVAAVALGGLNHSAASAPLQNTMDHYGAVLEYPGGAKVQLSHMNFSIPDRRFSGAYELVFCENAGVDIANAMAWDASGKSRELCQARGNETRLAMASFLESLLDGKRPEADIEVAYRATLSALLCSRALESDGRVTWDELESS